MILAPAAAKHTSGSDADRHYSDGAGNCDSLPRTYSRGWKPLPGTCQPRCSPPSNAIICPVIDGTLKM